MNNATYTCINLMTVFSLCTLSFGACSFRTLWITIRQVLCTHVTATTSSHDEKLVLYFTAMQAQNSISLHVLFLSNVKTFNNILLHTKASMISYSQVKLIWLDFCSFI